MAISELGKPCEKSPYRDNNRAGVIPRPVERSLHLYSPPAAGHKCPKCGKVCKTALALNGHMRSHRE